MQPSHQRLAELTRRFVTAFNDNDLDAVLSYLADDGVYDEFNGTCNRGKDAIRAALLPQFTGRYGTMRFIDDDLFVDAGAGKVMASWRCTLEMQGRPTSWRGLDLLYFEGDLLVRKSTYAKAKAPLFAEASDA
jgi:uncharacterized protein (TIGR02246 family)